MAHSCWGIAEIVQAIAANLVSDEAKASAVALATCCKSLKEPALGEVWRSLSNLAPLVSCFPPQVWEVHEELLYFQRAPLREEWARFQQQYASKIRHLKSTSLSEDFDISWAAFHMLQQLSDYSPLLPNLVSLSWESDEEYFPWASLFISRSLTSIVINVPGEATPLLPPFLKRLSTISPYIREIQVLITAMYDDPSMVEASSQLLMQCNRLQQFRVDSRLSNSVLRHAIQLPMLEGFSLIFDSSMSQLPSPLPAVVFPSLKLLDVQHNEGDHAWLNLISAIENPVLSMIVVECRGHDAQQFMETFQLTMTGCGMHERLKLFDLRSVNQFGITPHIVACNFPFKNLTTLHVVPGLCTDVCQTYDLADGDIDLLTNALPNLESLKLGNQPCCVPSKITFKSLYTISHRCTGLEFLQIHFNPTSLISTVADAGDIAHGLSNSLLSRELCSVTRMNVGRISLPEGSGTSPAVLALGLLGVFPHLEDIQNDDPDWKGIDDMIKVFRRMGRFEFGLGLLQGLGR